MTQLDERSAPSVPDSAAGGYQLSDRYEAGARPVLLTGVQAVARFLVEQHARDAAAGARTASLVSGYQGSPLAGLDKTLAGVKALRDKHGMHLEPGLNEELGATAVWGSQLELPGETRKVDGVVGVWYGKGPGVDRSGDVLRHANMYGAHPRGGAVVLAGDDPGSKSSTVPCVSERSLAAMGIPVLYPRNAAEVISMGLHAVALSRVSGCWVALKIVSDVADGLFTVDADFAAQRIVLPEIEWEGKPWRYEQLAMLSPTDSLKAEAALVGPRTAMVEAYAAANELDVVEVEAPGATLGIAATGAQFDTVRQALLDLGLDDAALSDAGIRLYRIGMPYPLGRSRLTAFAEGLDEILVVEEKTPFVESQVRDLLYGSAQQPRVLGKTDGAGTPLVPATGSLTADRLVPALRQWLDGRVGLREPAAPARRSRIDLSITPVGSARRIPYFCSGCPHNRSTVLPEGSIGGGGIGCHTMVTMAPRESAQVTGITQMGGEGAQWLGQAPFSDVDHIFQNVGDGTYFHSGQLALQACVAAGVNITYKILYNQVVAMTGAQDAPGGLGVPELTTKLAAEGVGRIIVCADEPEKYGRNAGFAPGVTVWHRDRIDDAQRELREVQGVSVLIYDQQCAAEARRLRKRGKVEARPMRVVINEAVCEGCGDCGVKSNCLSVQPVDTELGRKTRIDQTSCNTDYSCLDGDCPSFMTVMTDPGVRLSTAVPATLPSIPSPQRPTIDGTFDVFLAGIGGTGIVTVNALLATAALVDGLHCSGLDQTGLSQKAGPVTSHLRLAPAGAAPANNRISEGRADAMLAFDLMVAGEAKNTALLGRDRSTVIASTSPTPTGEMVYDPSVTYPDEQGLLAPLRSAARSVHTVDMLAATTALLGSVEAANLLLVGAAVQAGALPLSVAALEQAIALNGVAVEANLAAFRWGRVSVADPVAFGAATRAQVVEAPVPDGSRFLAGLSMAGETRRLADVRAAGMDAHSGAGAAIGYARLVERAWVAEQSLAPGNDDAAHAFSESVARGAHRLGAYKDEYEVARLLTDPDLEAQTLGQVPGAARPTYRLHPPMLRSAGMSKKISIPLAGRPALVALAKAKRLRGTALDPFGRAHVRRLERALLADYVATVARLADGLDASGYDTAVAVAETAEIVRGYEGVKLGNVAQYVQARAELGHPVSAEVAGLL